jgi:hypothetical protein
MPGTEIEQHSFLKSYGSQISVNYIEHEPGVWMVSITQMSAIETVWERHPAEVN